MEKNIHKKKYLCGIYLETSKNIPNIYMQRCLDLAILGNGNVAPNPMVGSVVVHNNKIIGEGYHEVFGGPHAEVNAINSVVNKSLLSESTLYVNLEPCNHFGKTPPCSHLIIEHKIPNVVIGCIDPFSEVAGQGIVHLQKHGINVKVGILEEKSRNINKRFFTFHEKQRPFVILKWAESNDGFADKTRSENDLGINWITQPETQQLTHKWRSEETAILVGHKTVSNDDPSLTCRAIQGNNPIRIVIDKSLKINGEFKILDSTAQTFIFNNKSTKQSEHISYVKINFEENIIPQILKELYKNNIQSVIIEGGPTTIQHFIDTNLWDEARVLRGVPNFKDGINSPLIHARTDEQFLFGKDTITVYSND
jgi:diaminohydroxyphosphoribosylaminopyrimidine deaminase/5-amino-6-(5-phosphoribosylamino)uracil reductase